MTITSALIDIGGSSVKVTIRNNNAGEIFSYENTIAPLVDGKHISLEPRQLLHSVIHAMNTAASKLAPNEPINKIYISTLRQGFCLIRENVEITPIYLNSDTSGEYSRSDIADYGAQRIYEETGHWFAPQLTLPKLINLFRVKPELRSDKTRLLFVHDWLVWKLSNVIQTEMTLVSAGQMADLSKRDIHRDLLNHFDIPATLVPEPAKFGTLIGALNTEVRSQLSSNWSSAELCVGGGDSHFLHMGASGNTPGKVVVSAGSSTPISLLSSTLGKSTVLQPWKSASFSDSAYFLEGNLGYPGSFFGWLNKNAAKPLKNQEVNMKTLSKVPTVFGSCNMWNEEKWESRPAFSILGDHSQSSSEEIALGLTLDYSFALANQISALIEDDFDINQVLITGGGANPQLQAILKSLLSIPVETVSSQEGINNLFSLLNDQSASSINCEVMTTELDKETSEFLVMQSKKHALLYEQVEGTRKVLENAR
jgi:sugar (pentulose or hexulose) kinase